MAAEAAVLLPLASELRLEAEVVAVLQTALAGLLMAAAAVLQLFSELLRLVEQAVVLLTA